MAGALLTAARALLPAAERQKHGDAWDEIAKAIPGRSATAAKARWETTLRFKFMPSAQGCAAGGGAKRPRAGWEDAGAERSRAAHRMSGKAMEMDDVEVSELDGAAAEHALNTSDWPGAAPESVGAGGHVGAEAGGKAAERDGAASPPTWQMCLPTGNVIDDGTFCPDDELFLQARPPVKSLLRGVETAAGGGDGGRGGRDSRDDDDDAGLGLRLELSPLSTMLTGAALERARQQCAAAALPAAAAAEAGARGGGGDHSAPPASPHGAQLDGLLAKLELGPLRPQQPCPCSRGFLLDQAADGVLAAGEIPVAGEGPHAVPVAEEPTQAPVPCPPSRVRNAQPQA